ncbi:MAG TPA: hypothetical protein VFR55_03125 [Dehalococcoidia bacterium]|nr:hypothetical protein [Dehalococcoidia bacterium]
MEISVGTFIISVLTSAIGSLLFGLASAVPISRIIVKRRLHRLFGVGTRDTVVFVFVHKKLTSPKLTLPEINPGLGVEDVMAISHLTGLLVRSGWQGRITLRHSTNVGDGDKREHLIVLGGEAVNTFTTQVLEILESKGVPTSRFRRSNHNIREWHIEDESHHIHISASYGQVGGLYQDDHAILMKLVNPWKGEKRIFILAGIRGIGTWGAADCLRKKVRDFLKHPEFDPKGGFSALIRVRYRDFDIERTELISLVPYPAKYAS